MHDPTIYHIKTLVKEIIALENSYGFWHEVDDEIAQLILKAREKAEDYLTRIDGWD